MVIDSCNASTPHILPPGVVRLCLTPFDDWPIEQVEDLIATDTGLQLAVTYGPGQQPDHDAMILEVDRVNVRSGFASVTDRFPPGDPVWRRIALRRHYLGLPAFITGPRDHGTTAFAQWAGDGDAPLPYAITLSAAGGRLLRRGPSGWEALQPIDEAVSGAFQLISTQEWLAIAALPNSPAPLYLTQDPKIGWTAITPSGFVEEGNEAVTSAALFAGRLYCGTLNARYGFQLWAAPIDHLTEPDAWQPVLSGAAGAYTLFDTVSELTVLGNSLYFGTCAAPQDRLPRDAPPASAELIRIDPEHRWDLVCGTPRFSPQGLKRPQLAAGGMGYHGNRCFTSLCVRADHLYLGTRNPSGCQLWWTDGSTAELVLDSGWDGIGADTITSMTSTRNGLAIAVAGDDGPGLFHYEPSIC